ncbi:MAG: succinyl-CoA synthetase subunit alpha [Microgenomates group bacterium Gr01-1014_7]|nr:MAG: succinyl-CoA synthetase subunit alpha [Microgenomates group bacterium Gr01-1014_7]
MAILVNDKTRVLIQGITGKEGSKVCLQMKNYATRVLAGVTPGKGGQEVHGVPVYNTVAQALENHPGINTSLISVPNFASFGAMKEAIESKIALINVFTEHVPIADTAKAIALAKQNGVRIVGPSSMGIISPGIGKVGQIGGEDPRGIFLRGSVGVISKSGGMASEVSWILTKNGIGQSTVVGIGGDVLVGSSFADLMEEFEKDEQTKAVIIFGEIGGTYEEEAADFIKSGKFTKKVVAFISGLFAQTLPQGTKLGHAGAIVYGEKGSYKSKIESLKEAGVTIAKTPDEIPSLLKFPS